MRINGDADSTYSTIGVSFVAGALSVSLIWYTTTLLNRYSDESQKESNTSQTGDSRIGELPTLKKSRSYWPWDKIDRTESSPRKPVRMKQKGSDTPEGDLAAQEKSGLCIGSIFGMDVGGTLAKLVYFEKSPGGGNNVVEARERHYREVHTMLKRRQSSGKPSQGRRSLDDLDLDMAVSMSNPDLKQMFSTADTSKDKSRLHSRCLSQPTIDIERTLRFSDNVERTLRFSESTGSFHREDSLKQFGQSEGSKKETDAEDANSSAGMRKSRSMLNLSKTRDQQQALDLFYEFAGKLDWGVKDHKLSFFSDALGGEFHFLHFETRRMDTAMDLIRDHGLHLHICEMGATGGGAHKYAEKWDNVLGIKMKKMEELDSLVAGMQFVLNTVVGECYTYRMEPSSPPHGSQCSSFDDGTAEEEKKATSPGEEGETGFDSENEDDYREQDNKGDWWSIRKVQRDAFSYSSTYPYLLVTIGTGVSVLRVDGPRKHERISGSTIGGGTYWGLIRLLTDLENFDDVMRLAEHGDPSKVDMLVGDIYGENSDALEKLGLPHNLVASSFGKLVAKEDPAAGLKQEDLARALLLMVTNNIGQVAYLNAQLHKTPRIYFVGNFLRRNKVSQRRLSYAIDYWSKGKMEALFLEHEGYFGALGAFLLSQDISLDDENKTLRRSTTAGDFASKPS